MARKQQWEKKAWEWALKTEPEHVDRTHVKRAYRVTFKPCKLGACKRNCRGNPNCLNHLGEAKWLTPLTGTYRHCRQAFVNGSARLPLCHLCWDGSLVPRPRFIRLHEDAEETEVESQVRPGEGFVGLRNLGATCYVNSLLQVWYHNPVFRTAIFNFQGSKDDVQTPHLPPHSSPETPRVIPHTSQSHSTLPIVPPAEAYSTPPVLVSPGINPYYRALVRNPLRASETEPSESKRQKMSHFTADSAMEADQRQAGGILPQDVSVRGSPALEPGIKTLLHGNEDGDVGVMSSGGDCPGEAVVGEGREEGLARPVNVPAVIGQLQLLFARLQYSNRRFIDPVDFIDSLSLQHDQQQDAQEFRKLFLSLLESAFQQQSTSLRQLIPELFGGTYAYVTRCEGCRAVSAVDSQFYELELNIKGHKMLSECLAEFFQQESLSDDNKYLCSRCNSKQDAKRFIQLKFLPPVLTLQLMRFVFDMSLLAKVKVTSYLIFPDTLDMSSYTEESSAIYQLTAVIVHCGPSAYSGHYIAHIREPKSGSWFRFDDDVVEMVKGDRLILGSHDDLYASPGSQAKKPRCPKGHHMSNNAYMLVYTKVGGPRLPDPVAPPDLQEVVALDNSLFDQLLSETMLVKAKTRSEAETKRQEMEQLYLRLGVGTESESYDWLRTSWLMQWLAEEELGSCRHEELLCQHNNLSLDKVTELKRVSSEIALRLYQKYTWDAPRLSSDMLCQQCVVERCREMHLQERVGTDQKTITTLLKTPCTSSSGFWVGKKSLQSWKRMVVQSGGFPQGCHGNKEVEPANTIEHREEESSKRSEVSELCYGTQLTADVNEQVTSSSVPASADAKQPSGAAVCSNNRRKKRPTRMVSSESLPCSSTGLLEPSRPLPASGGSEAVIVSEGELEVTSTTTTTCPNKLKETGVGTSPDSVPPPPASKSETAVPVLVPGLRRKRWPVPAPSLMESTAVMSSGPDREEERSSNADDVMVTSVCAAAVVDPSPPPPPPAGDGSDSKATAEARPGELNTDLLCEHGELCLSEGRRRLVPVEVWRILEGYFPRARSFPALHPPCPLCTQAKEGKLEQLEVLKAMGLAQKNELLDLYHGRNRPSITQMDVVSEVCVVPASFVEDWTAFVRYPNRYEQPSSVSTAMLLCEHGGFPFHITVETWNDFSEHLVYLWLWEWEALQQWYSCGSAVTLNVIKLEDVGVVIESLPVYCEECHQLREVMQSTAIKEEITTGYVHVCQAAEEDDELLSMVGMMETSTRSLRRRVPVGSKKIHISVMQTLQQLKLDVMYQFSVTPSDQRLFLKGVELEGLDKSLAELSVTPNSIIVLRSGAEEHNYEKFVRETAAAAKDQIEDGFKGTGLLQ